MLLNVLLLFVNFSAIATLYFLNETINSLQKENSKLVGVIQNLNNEIQYLKELSTPPLMEGGFTPSALDSNPQVLLGILGVFTVVLAGLTLLLLLKNDTTVMAELSKTSIQSTGDYIKEIVVPSVELLNKSSEARVVANLDNLKKIVTETGVIVTNHITDVNKESVLCIVNTVKPQVTPKVLGKISRELLNLIP